MSQLIQRTGRWVRSAYKKAPPPKWQGIMTEYNKGNISNKQMLGGFIAAAQAVSNPASILSHGARYLAGSAERDIIKHFLDNQHGHSGTSPHPIIPGSNMAYGKRKYSVGRKRTYGPRTNSAKSGKRIGYAKRTPYKKRVGGYKKKANPTLSLILKGMRNIGR